MKLTTIVSSAARQTLANTYDLVGSTDPVSSEAETGALLQIVKRTPKANMIAVAEELKNNDKLKPTLVLKRWKTTISNFWKRLYQCCQIEAWSMSVVSSFVPAQMRSDNCSTELICRNPCTIFSEMSWSVFGKVTSSWHRTLGSFLQLTILPSHRVIWKHGASKWHLSYPLQTERTAPFLF